MNKYCALLLFFFYSCISHASEKCPIELSSSSKSSDLVAIFACFNEKIKVLEDEIKEMKLRESPIAIAGEGEKNKEPKPADKLADTAIQTVEARGFKFNLSHCSRKGKENIVCELSVVSNKDTPLRIRTDYFGPGTIAITTSGVQHTAVSVSLGASGQGASISYRMLSGLPLRSLISFSSIPSAEKGFALLEILTDEAGKVSFRDVRFTDQG